MQSELRKAYVDPCCGSRAFWFDKQNNLVVFDPPHLVHAGRQSWLALKYGRLSKNWRQDIRQGFDECFRVLMPYGTLIFKWSEAQVPLKDVLALAPCQPLFGNHYPKRTGTHWLVFMKDGRK